ncbi:hypothetical protein [Bartonella sp. AP3QHHD]|uniref:hypothetical protein n=1 Tax=Bartonella sp. AP3QHHD TaxID=3243494 RepID=UPI0035D13126
MTTRSFSEKTLFSKKWRSSLQNAEFFPFIALPFFYEKRISLSHARFFKNHEKCDAWRFPCFQQKTPTF